jgi:hypothetical protein
MPTSFRVSLSMAHSLMPSIGTDSLGRLFHRYSDYTLVAGPLGGHTVGCYIRNTHVGTYLTRGGLHYLYSVEVALRSHHYSTPTLRSLMLLNVLLPRLTIRPILGYAAGYTQMHYPRCLYLVPR